MTEKDSNKFSERMTDEALAYPQSGAMTSARISIYFESLSGYELETITAALQSLRYRCKFFPSIAEICEAIGSSPTDRAEVAWRTLLRAISEGEMVSAYFYDKAMAYAVESMDGWLTAVHELWNPTPEMLASYEKRFKTSYRLATDKPALAKNQYFAGHCEASNRENLKNVSNWAYRSKTKFLTVQAAVISAGKYGVIEIPFDSNSMQMDSNAQAALVAGGAALRPFIPQKAIAAPIEEHTDQGPELSDDEKRELISRIRLLTAGTTRGDAEVANLIAPLEAGVEASR
jgi:hypothetical protein